MQDVQRLAKAASLLGLDLDEDGLAKLLAYNQLLYKWNKAYNLTAVKSADESIERNLIDSLAIAPFIKEDLIFDMGTGAGLPGIPLAIVFPDKQFRLVDSNGKKIRFINQVIRELMLTNVQTLHQRVEEITADSQPFAIVSRAFASVRQTINWLAPLLNTQSQLYMMKSKNIDQELAEISDSAFTWQKINYGEQLFDAERVLLKLHKN